MDEKPSLEARIRARMVARREEIARLLPFPVGDMAWEPRRGTLARLVFDYLLRALASADVALEDAQGLEARLVELEKFAESEQTARLEAGWRG